MARLFLKFNQWIIQFASTEFNDFADSCSIGVGLVGELSGRHAPQAKI
jgi:hypothetical protein